MVGFRLWQLFRRLLRDKERMKACDWRTGLGRRRGRGWAGAHAHIKSHGRPCGGAEASCKAVGRNWQPREDRRTKVWHLRFPIYGLQH